MLGHCQVMIESPLNDSWRDTITLRLKEAICRMNPAMRFVAAVLPLTILGFSSLVLFSRMIELVNQKLPKDQQVEYAYRYPGKTKKIRALYRAHYPTGYLAKWELGVEVMGLAWLFVVVVLLHSN